MAHILPGKLDEERATKSLEKTLTYYPHASGRIRQDGGDWAVRTCFFVLHGLVCSIYTLGVSRSFPGMKVSP
jgi:hypothetical protein